MSLAISTSTPLTVADLVELFGPIPAWRIRNQPAPGTATEQDVIDIEAREDRLCELVEGVLVEKTVGYDLVPDLAVEVLSEGNTPKEMSRKLDEYFGAGVRLVWSVDHRKRTVDVFTQKDACVTLEERQSLTGGDVLPGFKLPLKKLFADLPRPRIRKRKK